MLVSCNDLLRIATQQPFRSSVQRPADLPGKARMLTNGERVQQMTLQLSPSDPRCKDRQTFQGKRECHRMENATSKWSLQLSPSDPRCKDRKTFQGKCECTDMPTVLTPLPSTLSKMQRCLRRSSAHHPAWSRQTCQTLHLCETSRGEQEAATPTWSTC